MSALELNEAKRRAQEIVAFAERSENWYRPGETTWIPGNRPEFVLTSLTIRAVFTWTQGKPGDVRRHMSVSTMGRNYPTPPIVWTLAHFFGFQGVEANEEGIVMKPAPTWAFFPDPDEHCIVVQEKITT